MTSPTHTAASATAQSGADLTVCVPPSLHASVQRVAAAAGRTPQDVPRADLGRWWDSAPVVVLDASAALDWGGRLPRRSGVVVVSDGAPDIATWKAGTALGAEHVLALPDEEPVLVAVLAERRDAAAIGGGDVVAVVGACGGAGASTFSGALALCAGAGGREVLLVDVDPGGSGLDVLLGVENEPGLRWSGLRVDRGRLPGAALRSALPGRDSIRVLSLDDTARGVPAAPTASGVHSVLEAGRTDGGLVVCDVPFEGAAAETPASAAVDAADLVVVVVPATVRAVLAARRVAAWASGHNHNVGVVVRGPAPGGLTASDVAAALGQPVLASMRADRALANDLEHRGLRLRRRSPLAAAAATVVGMLDARPGGGASSGWSAA
ncbi:septum site-determining protein Ssd [Rhodococcus sp. HNM0569]|uniref:septum site-determining protein Ssd n=1 Tax=Rhodococcus sp. HNM0569 TaxID=2716340 RepID=UPI00146E6A87|nr:septum site-determining protein Ssd [Rhodococcus sp. HNM0569]NLU83361.1 hypothetical protein [Rhodococcus sp. HNM0569]